MLHVGLWTTSKCRMGHNSDLKFKIDNIGITGCVSDEVSCIRIQESSEIEGDC